MLRFYDVAIILRPAARYFAAVFMAKAPHKGKVFQNRFPQLVHDLLEFRFELRRVKALCAARMPCVPELRAAFSKIHADVTNRAHLRVLLWRLGKESARFLRLR